MAPPRLEVAGWALDGVSAGGCTGELVEAATIKSQSLRTFIASHYSAYRWKCYLRRKTGGVSWRIVVVFGHLTTEIVS